MYVESMFTKEEAEKIRDILFDSGDEQMVHVARGLTIQINRLWNENHDQNDECVCGHVYHRHFDSWEDMRPVGCKYCECDTFASKQKEA